MVKRLESYELKEAQAKADSNGQRMKDINSMEQLHEYRKRGNLRWHHRANYDKQLDEQEKKININGVEQAVNYDGNKEERVAMQNGNGDIKVGRLASESKFDRRYYDNNRENDENRIANKKFVFDIRFVKQLGFNPMNFDDSKVKDAFGYNERHDCTECGLHGFVRSICPRHNTEADARRNHDAFLKRLRDNNVGQSYQRNGSRSWQNNNVGNGQYRGDYRTFENTKSYANVVQDGRPEQVGRLSDQRGEVTSLGVYKLNDEVNQVGESTMKGNGVWPGC